MSHDAERELRGIALGENPSTLRRPPIEDPWLPLRAAGSLGAIDLALMRGSRVLIVEVKDAGRTYADGTAKVDLTESSGKGIEQREVLYHLAERFDLDLSIFERGFAVRAKGQIYDDRPRWTWHPSESVDAQTVLRARDAPSLVNHMG